ncbi:hypothetical protein DL764_003816 [Monosporascus ibericus]|uniref:Zn(2)-C6 fungal-type domain-containing protein n=1 Tax=Monosporascus ibericus TaxID=155417 RepID=A0A4Q4TIL6_9PEZI|nr:hypothetical protein DL764_003816 [Monosporascus ibericus]
MSLTTAALDPLGTSPKHRACDECRTRKLACTKEPDGCSRCKREGIVCHYSPQKPMGRPRKRPRDETTDKTSAEDAPATKNTMTELPPDTADPGMALINMLTGGEDFVFGTNPDSNTLNDSQEAGSSPWAFCYMGDDLGNLDFGTPAPPDLAQSFSAPIIDPALFMATDQPVSEPVPGLSPPNSASSGTPDSSSAACPVGSCNCMASLCLALDSMQKLPTDDVTEAVRQTRQATRTAYLVVNCVVCALRLEPPTAARDGGPTASAVSSFQTLMLLAALIPSIVHAYERILAAIDREAADAQRARRHLVFRLGGLGGFWGPMASRECGATAAYEHREMEPAMWRLVIRALLKLDVYGLSETACAANPPGSQLAVAHADPLHLGLRDIVTMMETRSKARHALVDAMALSGVLPEPPCAFKLHRPGETPTCQQIIAIAKRSVEQLVIA